MCKADRGNRIWGIPREDGDWRGILFGNGGVYEG